MCNRLTTQLPLRILALIAFALLGFNPRAAAPVPTTDTSFSMQFFNRLSPTGGQVQSRFFHAERGPQDQRRLFTGVRLVPVMAGGGDYLGIENGRVIHVIPGETGTNELSATVDLGDWVMSLAFDSTRRRMVMASLSGEGAFYKRTAIDTWSFLASLQNKDLESIVYRPSDDSLWGLEVRNGTNAPTLMQRYSAEGTNPQEWIWTPLAFEIRPGGYTSEMIMTDDDAIILLVERPYNETPQPADVSRMYVIRPEAGWFVLTYEKAWAHAPQIRFNTPTNGAALTRGLATAISVTANDPDGDLRKIEIFDNQASLNSIALFDVGESTFAPAWIPQQSGTHFLRAVVTDGQGAKAESSVQVTVINPPPAPGVRIMAPREGAEFVIGPVVPITAMATNVSGEGKVRLLLDGNVLVERIIPRAVVGSFPLSYAWTNTSNSVGAHTLTAVLENQGLIFTSAPVRINLLPDARGRKPVVRLISPPPTNAVININLGEPYRVIAEVSDLDDDIVQVNLRDGNFLLNSWLYNPSPSGTNRVEFDWTPTVAGNHGLYVTVLDAKQNSADTKTTVRVVVPPGLSVERFLPDTYTNGQTISVTLRTLPSATVTAYAVEEQPPTGWTLVQFAEGAVFDVVNRKIKWGPFTDAGPRLLAYTVRAPTNSVAEAVFAGTGSANGVSKPIGGDQFIAFFSPHHPADRAPEDFSININELTTYAGAWKQGTNWPTPPTRIPMTYVTRAGYLWKNGEAYHLQTNSAPPECWVPDSTNAGKPFLPVALAVEASEATRTLPPAFTPGRPVPVSIHVRPGDGVRNYALQDEPPAGWSIQAGDDASIVRGAVRFGPFYDDLERTLTYVVTPSANSIGGAFQGTASFDGSRDAIEGASLLRHSHAFVERDSESRLHLRFKATPGQRFDVESAPSLDSAEWQTIGQIEGAETPVDFLAIEPSDGERYFRLRPSNQ